MTYLVTIYGKNDDERHLHALLRLLNAGGIPFIAVNSRGGAYRSGTDAVVVINETSDAGALSHGGDMLILKENIPHDEKLNIGDFSAMLLPDEYTPYIITNSACSVITCGNHQKSSVTVSSNSDGCVCMFIQRRLSTLYGGVTEPQEVILSLRADTSVYDAMSAAVCRMMIDESFDTYGTISV